MIQSCTTLQTFGEIDFLSFIQESVVIGTWEVNIETNSVFWSDQTKLIHEVPLDYEPCLETGINFYKAGYHRNTIEKLFVACIEDKQPYDVELQIITAKGNEKWVRAIGKPIVINNKCIKTVGLFQDIDAKTRNEKALAESEEKLKKWIL